MAYQLPARSTRTRSVGGTCASHWIKAAISSCDLPPPPSLLGVTLRQAREKPLGDAGGYRFLVGARADEFGQQWVQPESATRLPRHPVEQRQSGSGNREVVKDLGRETGYRSAEAFTETRSRRVPKRRKSSEPLLAVCSALAPKGIERQLEGLGKQCAAAVAKGRVRRIGAGERKIFGSQTP